MPLHDAAAAGYLIWGAAIAAGFMVTGLFVVEFSTRQGLATLSADFLSQIVILALAVALGEVVRSRRALAAETATRLRLAEEERAAGAARVVAEERLRIAREVHDTVAHSMATITVQAGSALHLLGPNDWAPASAHPDGPAGGDADPLRAVLTAIRETSKGALAEMRSVLGPLRRSGHAAPAAPEGETGLGRLGAGYRAAGVVERPGELNQVEHGLLDACPRAARGRAGWPRRRARDMRTTMPGRLDPPSRGDRSRRSLPPGSR